MNDDNLGSQEKSWYYSMDDSAIGGCDVRFEDDHIVVTDDRFGSITSRYSIERYFSAAVEREENSCREVIRQCVHPEAMEEIDTEVRRRLADPARQSQMLQASPLASTQDVPDKPWWAFWK